VASGRLADEIPPHGTLCRVRRTVGLVASVPPATGIDPVQETRPAGDER
jgi:hypothetical protein